MRRDVVSVALDTGSIVAFHPSVVHERDVAIRDLLHENVFSPLSGAMGPWHLDLSIQDNRIVFDAKHINQNLCESLRLSPRTLTPIIRSYFDICRSYTQALSNRQPHQIEAIDMGRRGLHNEGAQALQKSLSRAFTTDHDTARRLFTLVCVLHIRAEGIL
jgi:uncharacterized protein (UPF0262 family)